MQMPGMLRHVALQGRTEGGSGWEGYKWVGVGGGGGGELPLVECCKSDQGLWPNLASNVYCKCIIIVISF